jgi:hypothetical protein
LLTEIVKRFAETGVLRRLDGDPQNERRFVHASAPLQSNFKLGIASK